MQFKTLMQLLKGVQSKTYFIQKQKMDLESS